MLFLRNSLFDLWLIILPFSWLFVAYTGFLAPDKIISPVLLFIGLVTLLKSSVTRIRRVIFFIFLATLFLFIKHISFLGSFEIFWPLLREGGINMGYFIIPLLCIDDMKRFRRTSWFIIVIALVGGVSALLVSTGLITLPVERFETSRLGVQGLEKAVGLFTSYGDFAQFISYAALWVIMAPGVVRNKKMLLNFMRLCVVIAVVAGLLGMQSRSVLLSLVASLATLWFMIRIEHQKIISKDLLVLALVSGFIMTLGLILFFASDIVDGLAGLGGRTAERTAGARIGQYTFAWGVIKDFPLFGADLETFKRSGIIIEGIHNIWLQLAAHGGLVTVAIMFTLLYKSFTGVRKVATMPAKYKESMVVTAYFASLFVSTLFYTGMGQLFWALLGIATSLVCAKPLDRNRVGVEG